MTILSKKQPGSTNNPAAQTTTTVDSSPTSTSAITLQPINEPIPTIESEESNLMNETTSGIKSPVPIVKQQDASDVTSSTVSPKVKSKKSNKRKIKSSQITIANNFVNQTSMASILSSSSSSSSSSGSYSFSYQNDQNEYYRLSDDSDYELNNENNLFFSIKNERKKSDSKSKKVSKPPSSAKIVKAKRNKNEIINNSENNNSEDEYEQSSSLIVNSSQDDTFIKSAKTLEELEQNFCRALKEKKGFIIKPMKEDGACLFRAVADQIYGDQEMHSTIRCHCMDYIAKNGDYFKQYMTEDIERYLARKRQDNCFGNHIEIIAIAEIYNRQIEVYEYSIEPKNTFQSEFQTDNEPIRLSYHGRMHYNSVVNPFKATIGVGLGLPQLMPGLADKNLLNEALKKSEDFQIEQAMLDDKMKATDWEATNDELMELVARESYLQWLKDNENRENVNFLQATTAASCSSWSTNEFTSPSCKEKTKNPTSSKSSPTSSSKPSSKISSASSQSKEFEDIDLFALTNQTVNQNDDDDILARVLAESQQEYLDSLKIKHQQQQHHSHQI